MPNPNAILSSRIRLDVSPERAAQELRGAEGGIAVELDEGRLARLDPADPKTPARARILEGLGRIGHPAYLELDPETATVTRLLIPHVARVVALREDQAGYEFDLDLSHARHKLRRDHPDFAESLAALREALSSRAPVALSEDDDHNLVDIRFFKPGPDSGPILPEVDAPRPRTIGIAERLGEALRWPIWPWRWLRRRCISLVEAQRVFDAMAATTCDPLAVPPPCIPFLYPDDGCWGRAHEMCRLMIAMGYWPKKVWIQGNLHTPTRNNPNCFVDWGWHVAPTLCVRQSCLIFVWSAQMVIDPSLFTGPVTQAAWKSVQGDPGATLTPSAASIFYLWGNVTDPTYVQTNQVLATYRLQLQNRSLNVGPPPYANCP
jgi:hypothetical protein